MTTTIRSMQEKAEKLAILASAQAEFEERLAAKHAAPGSFDSFGVEDGVVTVECFGQLFEAVGRPVTATEHDFAVEYGFIGSYDGQPCRVWACFLSVDGDLFEDAALTQSLCSSRDMDVLLYLWSHIGLGLVNSPLFRPLTQDGSLKPDWSGVERRTHRS